MNLKLLEVLQTIRPNAVYRVGDTYESLKWLDKEQTKPTKAEYDEGVKAYDAKEYQRSRASEYPSIPDQLDEIYHNGINAWKAIIKQTKDKFPKG